MNRAASIASQLLEDDQREPVPNPSHEIPVNKTAALVISKASRIHRDSNRSKHNEPAHAQETIRQALSVPGGRPPPLRVPDRRGERVGHLTVVAYGSDSAFTGRERHWVVRCDCGEYELRRHENLFNKNKNTGYPAACGKCQYTRWMKWRAENPKPT